MKKIRFGLLMLLIVCLFTLSAFAGDDPSDTISFKALTQDGYEKDNLNTLKIQAKVDRAIIIEDEKNPAPDPSPQGYSLFVRNYLFDVSPFTKPTKAELAVKELKAFAAPGEYAPLVFSIYPVKTLKNSKIL